MSLGRHVSQVKSLNDTNWIPSLLELINKAYLTGSNSVWEHTLLDPNLLAGKAAAKASSNQLSKPKKPSPTDPLHPTKEEFIRAKYQLLVYVNPTQDELSDLSEQLHSSVRTPNLKTSLRLLAAGADPNYFHPEKGTTPLHVAVNSGQILQVELLLAFGADTLIKDSKGRLSMELAASANQNTLVDRLRDAPYHTTDRLSLFVCGKKANHEAGQHILVPDIQSVPSESGQLLQKLHDRVLSELMKDLYDEVDRRELNQAMSSVKAMTLVPFLPVSQIFSRTRNQSRQKLATLIRSEFIALLVDVLSEFHRRNTTSLKVTSL